MGRRPKKSPIEMLVPPKPPPKKGSVKGGNITGKRDFSDPMVVKELLKQEQHRSKQEITGLCLEGDVDEKQELADVKTTEPWEGELERQPAWMKWLLTATVAAFIALQCGGMIYLEHMITHYRIHTVEHLEHMGYAWAGLLVLLAYGLAAGLGAALLVLHVSARAASSGIPDIKAYLNGNYIPGAMTFKTWLARSIGLVLVTSSGVFAGTEGPFAHIGAIVSGGIAGGRLNAMGVKLVMPWKMTGQRTQFEFMSAGAAMGVAAAFGAPVGGILFSLEEASTFWSPELTWRAFFGATLAAVIAKWAKTGFVAFPPGGFVEFPDAASIKYAPWELLAFIVLGASTGVCGAFFCEGVHIGGKLRKRLYKPGSKSVQKKKLIEVAFFTVLVLTTCFIAPFLVGCAHISNNADESTTSGFVGALARGHCHENEYSAVATILMQPKKTAIEALFTRSFEGGAVFTIPELLLCAGLILMLTIVSYGMATPYGLFVPNIMLGACIGRAMGQALEQLFDDPSIHPGLYAFMGAAGQLAGFSRMTVSLTMIMVEITSNISMTLPLMLTIVVSKFVGDRFTESVYDIGIELNEQIKMVEGEFANLPGLTIFDICTKEVKTVHAVETVRQLSEVLVDTRYQMFPIVQGVQHGQQLIGVVSRSKLVSLVSKDSNGSSKQKGSATVNVLAHADLAPDMKHWRTPLYRAFTHFKTMGLRQVCLVDNNHILRGIVTRTDMSHLRHSHTCRHLIEHILQQEHKTVQFSPTAVVPEPTESEAGLESVAEDQEVSTMKSPPSSPKIDGYCSGLSDCSDTPRTPDSPASFNRMLSPIGGATTLQLPPPGSSSSGLGRQVSPRRRNLGRSQTWSAAGNARTPRTSNLEGGLEPRTNSASNLTAFLDAQRDGEQPDSGGSLWLSQRSGGSSTSPHRQPSGSTFSQKLSLSSEHNLSPLPRAHSDAGSRRSSLNSARSSITSVKITPPPDQVAAVTQHRSFEKQDSLSSDPERKSRKGSRNNSAISITSVDNAEEVNEDQLEESDRSPDRKGSTGAGAGSGRQRRKKQLSKISESLSEASDDHLNSSAGLQMAVCTALTELKEEECEDEPCAALPVRTTSVHSAPSSESTSPVHAGQLESESTNQSPQADAVQESIEKANADGLRDRGQTM